MNDNKKQLCPNCKTGADALKLDPHEPMCPYMEFHNGQTCTKYVSFEKDKQHSQKYIFGGEIKWRASCKTSVLYQMKTANRLMLKSVLLPQVIMNKTENFHKVRIGRLNLLGMFGYELEIVFHIKISI